MSRFSPVKATFVEICFAGKHSWRTRRWQRKEILKLLVHSKLGEQAKKVHKLSDKLFKEFLRSQKGGTLTNAEYREWREMYDAILEEAKQRMKQATLPGRADAFKDLGKKLPKLS